MLYRFEILNRIIDKGVIAVIRSDNEEKAYNIASACINGGITAIEFTFTIPQADKAIYNLSKKFDGNNDVVIGAGTVLDSETARIAILSGAKYVVGPVFNEDTSKLCNRYQIPYIPGCMTVNEIVKAMESGADIIKVFPGSVCTPDFIRMIKAPLPQAVLMPSGGVNLDNVKDWIDSGCELISAGSDLTRGAKDNDYNLITKTARLFVQRVKEARKI